MLLKNKTKKMFSRNTARPGNSEHSKKLLLVCYMMWGLNFAESFPCAYINRDYLEIGTISKNKVSYLSRRRLLFRSEINRARETTKLSNRR